MDENNYKPNSNKYRETIAKEEMRERKESVVKGKTVVKQKSGLGKIIEIFFAKDIEDVKDYLIQDVLIPELRDAVYNLINNGCQMFLYGDTRTKRGSNGPGTVRISYNKCYDQGKPVEQNNRSRTGMNFDNVTFEDIADAEEVLNQMIDILEIYKSVSVADFCDLANIPDEYTDRKYGWTNLSKAEVRRVSGGGYYIKLPKAILLPS